LISANVGHMMNMVRNKASPVRIWFGGVDCVLMAFLRKPSTIMIRVNEVIIRIIDGATDRIVISSRISSGCEPSTPISSCNNESDSGTGASGTNPVSGGAAAADSDSAAISKKTTTNSITPDFRAFLILIVFTVLFFLLHKAAQYVGKRQHTVPG
jgi:hypothetical protein